VLAAGVVGSGSTFLYNVAREILQTDRGRRTIATYSDEWNPHFAGENHLVLKSHWGIRALLPLAERGVLQPVISVRHPGDCVCSDVERFGFAFEFALQRVSLSLEFCGLLRRLPDTLLFRYEDDFAVGSGAAARLARRFGAKPGQPALDAISAKYAADQVRLYADRLSSSATVLKSADNPNDAWCPTTQIHLGHIGKRTPGRWRDLPPAQRRAIDDACGEDAASFGYDCRA
jgi:hypothetical protein